MYTYRLVIIALHDAALHHARSTTHKHSFFIYRRCSRAALLPLRLAGVSRIESRAAAGHVTLMVVLGWSRARILCVCVKHMDPHFPPPEHIRKTCWHLLVAIGDYICSTIYNNICFRRARMIRAMVTRASRLFSEFCWSTYQTNALDNRKLIHNIYIYTRSNSKSLTNEQKTIDKFSSFIVFAILPIFTIILLSNAIIYGFISHYVDLWTEHHFHSVIHHFTHSSAPPTITTKKKPKWHFICLVCDVHTRV